MMERNKTERQPSTSVEQQIGQTSGAQSVDRALALLKIIGRHNSSDGMSLTELTEISGLNKATVRRLLLALINGGLVDQAPPPTLRYRLGPEAYLLGLRAGEGDGLTAVATRHVAKLTTTIEDAVCLSVRHGFYSLCLHREDGPYPIRTHALMPGHYHPLGVGAGSLAMLAALPDAEVERVLAVNHEMLAADFPLLMPDNIRTLVDDTRRHGYALNPGQVFSDSWGLGMALRWPDGSLAGALSVAAIASRMQSPRLENQLLPQLQQATQAIEAQLASVFHPR